MNIVDFEFLEQGHVFTRNDDGRAARFLFMTNTALPKKVQKMHPPQVVYADENNNILSCSPDLFLAKRSFYNVDPVLEARLRTLLDTDGSEESDEDTLDLETGDDDLLVSDGPGSELDLDAEEPSEDPADAGPVVSAFDDPELPDDPAPPVTYIAVNAGLPTVLDPIVLAKATASYQQTPNQSNGNTQHVLFIRAGDGVTRDSLYASFSPTHEDINTVYSFSIDLEGRRVVIDWDRLIGIYPAVFYEDSMYQVILESVLAEQPQEIDPPAAPAVAEEPAAETSVEAELGIAPEAPAAAPVAVQVAVTPQAA